MKTKNLSYAHVMVDGTIKLFFKKRDSDSGKYIEWSEEAEEKIIPKIMQMKEYKFTSIYFDSRVVKLLAKMPKIEIWPQNHSNVTQEFNMACETVVVILKDDIEISFTKYTYNGRPFGGQGVNICCHQ